MATSPIWQSVDAAELARCLFEESNDALLVFDPTTLNVLEVNARVQKLTGFSRDKLLQSKLPELFDTESPSLLRNFVDVCQQTQSFQSHQAYRLTRDGCKSLEVNVTVSRIQTKPTLLGLVAARDVSELRSHQSDLMKPEALPETELDSQSARLESDFGDFRVTEEWLRETVNDVDAIVEALQLSEGRLRQSEQRLKHLISNCPVTLYTSRPSGDYGATFVSDEIKSQTGYEMHEFTDDADFWVNHVHPGDRDRFIEKLSILSEHGHVSCEYRFLNKNGTYRWMHDQSSILPDIEGNPKEIIGFWMDITERKLSEQSLRKSEARYRSLVVDAPVCIHEIDLDGRLESINPAGLKMVSIESESDAAGQDYLSFVDEKDRARIATLLEQAFNGEASFFEFTSTIDGNPKLFSSNFNPIINQSGDVQKVMGTTEDITERRGAVEALQKSEVSLRRSEQRLKHLISNCPVALYTCKASGDFGATFVSDKITAQTGYETHEFIEDASFWDNLIHPDDRDRIFAELSKLPDLGRVTIEYRFRHKDGTYRWMHDESSILTGIDGKPESIVGFWMDISQRKSAEEQLRQKELQLAHVARLSTMGEMVAGIAHEINQPLSAIANFAAASRNALGAMNDEDNNQIKSWMQQVNEQAIYCGDIIRRLRDFVRKDDDDPECVELNQVVRDSVALIESTLRHQSIVIDCQMPELDTQIIASHVQLQQVMLNLMRNACDASLESPTPRIIVLVEVHDGHAHLSVEDNGPGIEESHRSRLFDAFFTTKPDGMGMGLPISKSIVEAHGGSLRFDAEHCEGARFHIKFPVADTAKSKNANIG